jgi:hypothetical protein
MGKSKAELLAEMYQQFKPFTEGGCYLTVTGSGVLLCKSMPVYLNIETAVLLTDWLCANFKDSIEE